MLVFTIYISNAGRALPQPLFNAVDIEAICLRIYSELARHETWSFVAALDGADAYKVLVDPFSYRDWRPKPEQRAALKEELTQEELARPRAL